MLHCFKPIAVVFWMLIASTAAGQTSRPATQPATRPTAFILPQGVVMMLGSSRFTAGQTIVGIGFSPDGTRILTTHNPGPVRLWDTQTGELIRQMSNDPIVGVSASFVGDDLVAISWGTGGLTLHRAATG